MPNRRRGGGGGLNKGVGVGFFENALPRAGVLKRGGGVIDDVYCSDLVMCCQLYINCPLHLQ